MPVAQATNIHMRIEGARIGVMSKRDVVGYLSLALAAVAASGLYWYMFLAPQVLRISVSPPIGGIASFLTALGQTLDRERASVRVQVIPIEQTDGAASALEAGRADLAIVRADMRLPASSLAIAALQDFVMLTLARPDAGITNFADLGARNVGVVGRGEANMALFRLLAEVQGLNVQTMAVTAVDSIYDMAEMVEHKKLDAVFFAGPRGGRITQDVYRLFSDALETAPVHVAFNETRTLLSRNPAFIKSEIGPGELRSTPLAPEKTVSTIAFPALIVTRSNLRDAVVQDFTRSLFRLRLSLSQQYPAAGRIAALPTSRDSAFPLHPGAATYYDASETTFLERYSDLLWLALFGLSGIISLLVWLWRLAIPKARRLTMAERDELIELIERARNASDPRDLDDIERRADRLVVAIASQLFDGTLEAERQPSFDLLLSRLSGVIDGKRQRLSAP